jgi:hypothetical protein
LNGRDAQNVLNANGVTIDDSGNLVWTLAPADNAIVSPGADLERHRAVFDVQWSSTRRLVHEVEILVRNVRSITS